METIITQTLGFLTCFALGLVVSAFKVGGKKTKAVIEGVKTILRKELIDAYEDYCIDGKPLSLERKHEIEDAYSAYIALGGNGTAEAIYKELGEVDITILKGGKHESMD